MKPTRGVSRSSQLPKLVATIPNKYCIIHIQAKYNSLLFLFKSQRANSRQAGHWLFLLNGDDLCQDNLTYK